jgi:REP element-mobilizing transposase RayT
MINNPYKKRGRRSIRLKGFDYTSPGAYFITICTDDRICLFGRVANGEMRLNNYGILAADKWVRTQAIRPRVTLDEFIIMPNHMHGIIIINDITNCCRGTSQCAPAKLFNKKLSRVPPAPTLERFGRPTSDSIPTIVRLYKSVTTKRINELRGTPGVSVWQRNYYERIIRDEKSLNRIRKYIFCNAMNTKFDKHYTASLEQLSF